jgi:hypothetical protein
MVFAIQHLSRPKLPNGQKPGIFLVNDGSNTVAITSNGSASVNALYHWLGNGDENKGRVIGESSDCLTLPSLSINAQQYNALVTSLPTENDVLFKGC